MSYVTLSTVVDEYVESLNEVFIFSVFPNPFLHFIVLFLVTSWIWFNCFGMNCMHDTNILSSFQCPLLNISYCPATEVDLSVGKKIVSYILIEIIILLVFLFTLCSNLQAVLVYNSLGWKRTSVVRIPVSLL